jgi:hypothetical protein
MTTPTMNLLPRTVRAVGRALLAATLLASISPSFAADAGTPSAADTVSPLVEQAQPVTSPPAALKKTREKSDHEKRVELMGISLGFVAVVMGIGIAFFAVWCDYRKRQNLIKACHEERMAALEKGFELPPYPRELGAKPDAPESETPSSGLEAGLIWLGVGIGALVFSWKIGGIPLGVGVAYLVYYLIEGRKRAAGAGRPKV